MTDKTPPKDLLDWLGITNAPNWRIARPLGGLLSLVIALLLIGALFAAFALLGRTIAGGFETAAGNLGAGALIVALLGAPFLVWSTVIKQKTVEFQKESHITERISKAVEQLGEEKTVDRIGRPITIWTGHAEKINYATEDAERFQGKPRTKVMPKEWSQSWNHETDEVEEGYRSTVATWPEERTVIQWQGETVDLKDGETIGVEGPWQAFSETVPNIEVRIGGLLSLERIAQDSTHYDKGRDHVRVMEILCAYVRENAPNFVGTASRKPAEIPQTRIDVQTALSVIGRRSPKQVNYETNAGYRLDLRNTDLSSADLRNALMMGALFSNSCLEHCDFRRADLTGTRLDDCTMNGTVFWDATIDGTIFNRSRINRPEQPLSTFTETGFRCASIEGVDFSAIHLGILVPAKTYGSADTKLKPHKESEKQSILASIDTHNIAQDDHEFRSRAKHSMEEINASAFRYWTPYGANDLANGEFFQAYKSAFNLNGWPYEDP